MRVLFFGNGAVAAELAAWITAQGDEIVGLVLHPEERSRDQPAIIAAAGGGAGEPLPGHQLKQVEILDEIQRRRPDIGVSAFFGYRVPAAVLSALPGGCVNVHPAWLPFNRGAFPNVWAIIDGTPAGATIHYMDAGFDTGDVIARRKVDVEPVDTGGSLYRKLERTCVELFRENWPAVRTGRAPRVKQDDGGTSHRVADVAAIDEIRLDQAYQAGALIDILRARTFHPHEGAFFRVGKRKVFVRLNLTYGPAIDD